MENNLEAEFIERYKNESTERMKHYPKPWSEVTIFCDDGYNYPVTFIQSRIVRTMAVGENFLNISCMEIDKRFFNWFAATLRYRRSKGFDNLVLITGEERSGKSTAALTLALTIDPALSLDNVTFKLKDFDKAIANAKDGEVIVMDEAGVDLYSKEWFDQFQIQLVKKLFIIGLKHLTLIMVLPHRLDLNKDIRDRRIKYWIDVKVTRGSLGRGFAVLRESVSNEWLKDPFWDTTVCFHFDQADGGYWTEYEKKKSAFVDEMNTTSYLVRGSKRDEKRNEAIIRYIDAGNTQASAAEFWDLSKQTISDIWVDYKNKIE